MHEVLVNRLGGLSLPRKSVVRLTDRPDMTSDVYHGCKTTTQQSWSGISDEVKQNLSDISIASCSFELYCKSTKKKKKKKK